MLKALALRAIARYRDTGGGHRWFGVDCNFEPSCSAYAQQAIGRFGLHRIASAVAGCALTIIGFSIFKLCRRTRLDKRFRPIIDSVGSFP